jgi:hypothetical protein
MMLSRISSSRVSWTITRRSLTTATAAAASPLRRLVISRRVWQAHEKTLPKVKPKPKADSSDDKPWPQSVRIAGAVVGGIFIPYSIVWFITSNPSIRDMFQDYLPMDRLRTHFGEVEWGAQSYVDAQMDKEANVVKEAGLYQFPGEITWKDRKQQEIVEKMEASDVTANLYVLEDNAELKQTKQVPASTRANRKVLSELVGTEEQNVAVAVDFEEDDDANTNMEDTNYISSSMGSSFSEEQHNHNPIQPLLQQTHTFSTWYYHSNLAQQAQEQQASNNTDTQMEQSRLEYTVSELEKNLKDPNCTRDIDDMMTELRQSQRDLSRLKWKRRLGM